MLTQGILLATLLALVAQQVHAGEDDQCQAGPKETWQSKVTLEKQLLAQGWRLRRIRVDECCYEVFGLDAGGRPVEARFHPQTLKPVRR